MPPQTTEGLAESSFADEVLALTQQIPIGRTKTEHKPLSSRQIAKIGTQRLDVLRRRARGLSVGGQGTIAEMQARVLRMNAADLGLTVEDYIERFREVLVSRGVVL